MFDNSPRFRIGRFAGEALSVTAGVLLAFSVDAWWARIQEREVVHGLREAANVEAMANREVLERYREVGGTSLRAAQKLTVLIGPDPVLVSTDSLLSLMGRLLTYNAAPLEFAATDRLLASGDIAVLEPAFHRGLLSLRAAATRYADQGRRFEQVHEALIAEFGQVAPLGPLSASKGVHPPSDFPLEVTTVLTDQGLEGAVGNLAVWVDNLNVRVAHLVELTDSVWAPREPSATPARSR